MANLQEIFNRIKANKDKQRTLRKIYKDALDNNQEHKKYLEDLKRMREAKKQVEDNLKAEFRSEFDQLDGLKLDIETDNQLLSDLALNELVKGRSIEIVDQGENKYEPIFSVKFKKT